MNAEDDTEAGADDEADGEDNEDNEDMVSADGVTLDAESQEDLDNNADQSMKNTGQSYSQPKESGGTATEDAPRKAISSVELTPGTDLMQSIKRMLHVGVLLKSSYSE